LDEIDRRFLADEEDPRLWGKLTNSSCGVDSIELRESNVQQDQVRAQRPR
jgi:hypothetical protein